MITKKAIVKVRGEKREVDLMLPTTIEEAVALVRAIPKKDLFRFLESKMRMDARLKLLNEGKPKKEKKRIVLRLDSISEALKKKLREEELL